MASGTSRSSGVRNIEVFLGGAPLLEPRLVEGLLAFGQAHPQWRFALRGADFRYTAAWLRKQRIAGALALIEARPLARALRAAGIPWVHLLPPAPASHPSVNVDNAAIGRMGAEYFLTNGFLRFAFLGVGTAWSDERRDGFVGRLGEANLPCTVTDIPFATGPYWELAPGRLPRLRKWVRGLGRHTAVMVAHDLLANRVVDLCLREEVRVPEALAVLGVGNHDLLCKLSPIPISSIDAAVPEVAVRGARMLKALLEGGAPAAPESVPPARLVERRSTEVLAFDDPQVAAMVSHIRDHVCDGLTVEDLHARFPVSRRTLSRRFLRCVGHTPGAEIRQARLRHARRLLRETNLTLTQVAAACGYADLSHMDRSFRRLVHAPPGALRKR